jgi:hypothetical protein
MSHELRLSTAEGSARWLVLGLAAIAWPPRPGALIVTGDLYGTTSAWAIGSAGEGGGSVFELTNP